ncbi:hypothetical protein BDP67DRAFT_124095 [Colletotrichum lupini]|nr:hypothetical protein BDP67DRAFT_124095 [Colletotrichum lupini]
MTKTHRSKVASDCVQMRSMQGNKTPRGAAPLSTNSAGICPRPLLNNFFFSFPKTISTFYISPLPRRILVFELSYWLGEAVIQPRLDHLLLRINHLPPRPCFLDEPPRRNQLGTFQLTGLMQLTLFLSLLIFLMMPCVVLTHDNIPHSPLSSPTYSSNRYSHSQNKRILNFNSKSDLSERIGFHVFNIQQRSPRGAFAMHIRTLTNFVVYL